MPSVAPSWLFNWLSCFSEASVAFCKPFSKSLTLATRAVIDSLFLLFWRVSKEDFVFPWSICLLSLSCLDRASASCLFVELICLSDLRKASVSSLSVTANLPVARSAPIDWLSNLSRAFAASSTLFDSTLRTKLFVSAFILGAFYFL